MIHTKTKKVSTVVVEAITCDKCGKKIPPSDEVEWQEIATIAFRGGFGSVFGDGSSFRCDLCQHCLKDTLGPYIKCVDEGNDV